MADDARVVVVYERVSSDRQDIARQAVQRERARDQSTDERAVVVIQDDGVSAFKVSIFDRPGGRRLCELIEAGGVEAVYTDAQDRLSRGDDLEWVSFRALCESKETRIIIDGRELRNDLGGRLEGYLKALLARQESEEKSHRVRSGKAASARKGKRNGGPRPYGYVQRDGELMLVRHEAEVIRRLRDEVLAGRPLREIARRLNEDGITTSRGAKWSQTRVSQMLANRLYVGKVRHYGDEHDGEHEPVFTTEEWDELQKALAARRRQPGKGRGRQPQVHLFARGMLRCGYCGNAIVPRRTKNAQGRVYERYRCLGQLSGSAAECPMPSAARDVIDTAVYEYFAKVGLDHEATRRRIVENVAQAAAQTRAARAHAERQRSLADERLARVTRDYQDGKLDAEDWREQRDELRNERDAAVSEVARLAAREREIELEAGLLDSEHELLEHLANLRKAVAGRVCDGTSVEAMRSALLRLFDGFSLHAFEQPEVPPALPRGWVRSALYTHPNLMPPGVGGLIIEPHPRVEMILDDKEIAFPELRRVPLEARVRMPASGR